MGRIFNFNSTYYLFSRYPSTLEEFYQSRLPGTFDEERANKRMKLPTPETWETQVALKGNKATTWQDLIGELAHYTFNLKFCLATSSECKLIIFV